MVEVLIAAGVMFGLSGALAALLVLAERYFANYGTCAIDVNDGSRRLEVRGGESLLMSLRSEGIFIPSACGGRGTCAYCKVRVLQGAGPVAPTEEPLLAPGEIASDVRISCLCKVRGDVKIVIPDELLSVGQFRGAVERIRDLTHDTKELRIRLLEPGTIEFVPGQYIQLEAPAYGDNPRGVFRAYSISSPPGDGGHIELVIRLVPGGICTTWVFTVLAEGDEVSFTGPYGEFRLSQADSEMIWIAGGSGMAPFWSMIRHLAEKPAGRRCTYFFGAVNKRDLFYVDELTRLGRELDWFSFVPALSGEGEEGWGGQRGLIIEVAARHLKGGSQAEAYLCGSPGMVDAAVKVLHEKGIGDERIFYDKFI